MMNLSIEIFSSIYYILKSTRIDLVDYIIILKEKKSKMRIISNNCSEKYSDNSTYWLEQCSFKQLDKVFDLSEYNLSRI